MLIETFLVHLFRNTRLIILANEKPADAPYQFRASFLEPAIINVDKPQDFLMKVTFNSHQPFSEQIVVKIIDEEKNWFVICSSLSHIHLFLFLLNV